MLGRDIRNELRLECGLCGDRLLTCFNLPRFVTTCERCGAKYEVVWSCQAVRLTCISDLSLSG